MGQVKELVRMAEKLNKMVSRNKMEGALDLLKKLNSFKMTIQLLQSTRIGVAVNAIRKHCLEEEVVALAKILIKNWKKLLEASKMQKGRAEKESHAPGWKSSVSHQEKLCQSPDGEEKNRASESARSYDSTSSLSSSSCSSPKNSSVDSYAMFRSNSKSRQDAPKTPTSPISPVFPPSSPVSSDSVRSKCIEMISAALKMDDDYKEFGVNCEKIAAEIEDNIYQELKSTDIKYRNRVRSRISNLKDPKNPNLRRNVLCGAIAPSLIAKMTAEEMASDELKELRNAMTQEAIREHQMAKTGGTTTDLFQCGKCKKKNCTYNQVQTRSADEPMTTFVLCNECGNRWKFC
ncbi:transcription elongation factor A protein 3 isoform X1 [Pogona vitticeps]